MAVKGEVVSRNSLPPYSIEEPTPGADGCTLTSLFKPQWTFSTFEADSINGKDWSVSFNIILSTPSAGYQFPISITQGTNSLASDSWYPCVIGEAGDTGDALWPTDCSVQYNSASKELNMKANWTCADLDPNHP